MSDLNDKHAAKRILFVCLGNICRSPMAECIFGKLVDDRGLGDKYRVDSCGTSDEEEGNGVYPPARKMLASHGMSFSHTARQITLEDARDADCIIVMDASNRRGVTRVTGGRFDGKVHRLLDFTPRPRDVADPWYTRDFERAYNDIAEGCAALLEFLENEQ